ncbi:MAG: MobA/MobL family protein, partial [Thiomonas sp.]
MKVGKAGKAAPHAAYIAREGQYANRLERGEKLEATEAGNMPAWAQSNPLAFWQAADAFERKNGTTYREMEIALPRELSADQRAALVREFVRQEIGDRHAYQWAIHTPKAADGQEQPHLHLMFSERQRDRIERDPEQYFKRYNPKAPEKGGARKGYGQGAGQTLTKAERAAELKALRGRWEAMCNAHLERAGLSQRIDMRSHAERGTGLEPERKQLPSQWRGQGRATVIEFRKARAELVEARQELARAVPDARAEIVRLEAEQNRRIDPATTLAEWLAMPPIARSGSMEGISRQNVLENLSACHASGHPLALMLGEAEQTALRQAGWMDRAGTLTPKGQSAVQWHQAQQVQQAQAAAALAARQAEQRRVYAPAPPLTRQPQAEQDQERLDAQTAAGAIDGIRAPRRTAQDWQRWRAHVLTQAYGDQVEAAELARDWRVERPRYVKSLTLRGADGQSIDDFGDRICPSGDARWNIPLQDATLRTALQLAQLKGWDRAGGLDITGSAEFRERAARMATRMGLPVANADLQHIVLDERARMQQTAQHPPFSTKPVDKPVDKSPAAAPQPASPQPRAALPTKQATPDPAQAEALAFLGTDPAQRWRRWDALVRRAATPP